MFKGCQITSCVVHLFNFSFVPLWINSQLKIDNWRMNCRIWQPRRSQLPTGKLRLQKSFSGTCATSWYTSVRLPHAVLAVFSSSYLCLSDSVALPRAISLRSWYRSWYTTVSPESLMSGGSSSAH